MPTPVLARPGAPDVAARVGDPRIPLDPVTASSLIARLTAAEIKRAAPDIDYVTIMTDPDRCISGALFDTVIGSLRVLGYGRCWLARALHVDERHLEPGRDHVDPRLMHRALTAAIRIGNRWATPDSTGQSAPQIAAAQQQATDLGFSAPAAYTNLYVPDSDVLRPEYTDRDGSPADRAAKKIRMLAYFCKHGGGEGMLSSRFQLSPRIVGRTRKDNMGLDMVKNSTRTRIAPGQDDLVAVIDAAAEALDAGEDPVEVWKKLCAYAGARAQRDASQRAVESARAVSDMVRPEPQPAPREVTAPVRVEPSPAPAARAPKGDCTVRACTKTAVSNGLCSGHRDRRRRFGDVLEHIPLRHSNRHIARGVAA